MRNEHPGAASIGAGTVFGLLGSNPVAADRDAPEHDPLSAALTVKDGRVVVDEERQRGPHAESALTANAERLDADQALDAASLAAIVNDGVDRGYWQVSERNGRVFATPTVQAAADGPATSTSPGIGATIGTASCGRSDLTYSIHATNAQVTIWLDHELSKLVQAELAAGTALTGIAALIAAHTGVGAVPAVILGVITIALGYYGSMIGIYDDGCGVKITYTKYYIPGIPAFGSIQSQ